MSPQVKIDRTRRRAHQANVSGAIAALASNISRLTQLSPEQVVQDLVNTDKAVLDRLASIFESTFGIKLEDGRLSPV